MKTVMLIAVLLMTFMTGSIFAQQEGRPHKTPEEFAKHRSDMLKTELQLTDDQYKQVYSIFLEESRRIESDREKIGGLDKEERNAFREKNREQLLEKMKGVLTKEQLEKFSERSRHKHEGRKGRKSDK